ncbi:MAG: T9SS type A sorting domain-containing protein [Chitinophagales bacterium]
MKQNILLILVTIFGIQLNAQLVSYEKIDSFTVAELQAQIVAIGFGSLLTPEYPVDLYRVMYRTEFLDSTTVISGALAVPRNTICKVPMVNYAHGTSSKKLNVPSYDGAEKNIVVFFASIGNVVCASDFIGLGASNISLHPYMHGFSQAHSSLNIMRATRELKNELDINLGNQIYSFGYSQGGFVSAMLVKYIEQWYSDEFKITAAAPMSGPYNIHGAQYEMVNSGEPYATPGYLPYIIFSYQMMYGGLYDNVSEIFKNPYDTLMPILFEGHQNSIGYISGEAAPIPTDMIIDSVQNDINTNPYHKFRLALFDNDLLRWTPKTPMKLLYCEGDEQVSYRNSQIADSLWNYNGANNISSINHGDFTHSSCLPFALLAGLDFFKSFGNNGVEIVVEYNENNNSFEASILHEEIADYDIAWSNGNNTPILSNISSETNYTISATHKTKGCSSSKKVNKQTVVSIQAINSISEFAIYPNPAKNILNLIADFGERTLDIYNVLGAKVYSKTINSGTTQLNISKLAKGTYYLQIQETGIIEKFIVE